MQIILKLFASLANYLPHIKKIVLKQKANLPMTAQWVTSFFFIKFLANQRIW